MSCKTNRSWLSWASTTWMQPMPVLHSCTVSLPSTSPSNSRHSAAMPLETRLITGDAVSSVEYCQDYICVMYCLQPAHPVPCPVHSPWERVPECTAQCVWGIVHFVHDSGGWGITHKCARSHSEAHSRRRSGCAEADHYHTTASAHTSGHKLPICVGLLAYWFC